MDVRRKSIGCLFSFLVICTPVWAQVEDDSLKTFDLSEIIIGGEARQADRIGRLHRVGLAALARQDRPDIAGVLRMVPSAHLQTNSRGETLVYIRGAGERQVAIFLDGAPLNIGWDRRMDLSLIPVNVLGGITSERGAVSAAYGPNVSGGAINLQSRSLDGNTRISELTLQAGSPASWQTKGMFAGRRGSTSVLIGATLESSDGAPVPGSAQLPFSQSRSGTRTNTDREARNIYLRIDQERVNGSWGLTVLHGSAHKGVAPESHLDPTKENVRFWRYPLWRNTMAILNGVSRDLPVHLSGTIWVSRFRQIIEQYETDSYRSVSAKQSDFDQGAGIRFISEWKKQETSYRGIGFISTSAHQQTDSRAVDGLFISAPELSYRQVLFSFGGEIASSNGLGGHWVAGLTLDGMKTPGTGDKPEHNGFSAWSANLETDIALNDEVALVFNAGSKPRFPTMRELFGVAMNRFILNSSLRPERAWIGEMGIHVERPRRSYELLGFIQRTIDTIDQINVTVDGRQKRKRINLDGSRVFGVELAGIVSVSERLSISGHSTWMKPVAIEGSEQSHLSERPEILMTLNANLTLTRGVSVTTSIIHTGRAFALARDNTQKRLPTSTILNVRASSRKFFSATGLFLELYMGVNNVTDNLHLPQLGLPSSGRTARVGLNLSY